MEVIETAETDYSSLVTLHTQPIHMKVLAVGKKCIRMRQGMKIHGVS